MFISMLQLSPSLFRHFLAKIQNFGQKHSFCNSVRGQAPLISLLLLLPVVAVSKLSLYLNEIVVDEVDIFPDYLLQDIVV